MRPFFAYRVGSGFMPALDEGGFILDYIAPGLGAVIFRAWKNARALGGETESLQREAARRGRPTGALRARVSARVFPISVSTTRRLSSASPKQKTIHHLSSWKTL
jgi:hypothetical protein